MQRIKTPRMAPLNVPLHRRLQTLAVLWFAIWQLICIIASLCLLFTPLLPAMLLYFVWIYLDKAPINGGRKIPWVRNFKLFQHLGDYFPVSLEKTEDLSPDKTYVFGYHPHGIISVGALVNFATEATGFSAKFPGIDLRLMTLAMNFRIPFFREYLLSLGVCDVSNISCNNILRKGPGNAIMIVVGGAAEALDARPGSYDLVLARRKGFVRVALENGACLVPVISFGETDVFDQVDNKAGTELRQWQNKLQKQLGFSMPLFHGRGIFNYDFGLLPHRRPITSIVGKPIECPKTDPNDAELLHKRVDEYHQKYIEDLTELFNTHKKTYLSEDATITFN